MAKCAVCERNWEKGVTLTLSEAERAVFRKVGLDPVTTLFYCNPCYRLLSENQAQAASFMKGVYQVGARAQGVAPALVAQRGDALYTKLLPGAALPGGLRGRKDKLKPS